MRPRNRERLYQTERLPQSCMPVLNGSRPRWRRMYALSQRASGRDLKEKNATLRAAVTESAAFVNGYALAQLWLSLGSSRCGHRRRRW